LKQIVFAAKKLSYSEEKICSMPPGFPNNKFQVKSNWRKVGRSIFYDH